MAKQTPKISTEEDGEELSESYISIGLGLLVVVVVGILLYNYFTQKNNQPTSEESENLAEEATMSAQPGSTYTVVEGDTLWSISEKSYGTGFNWTEIAKENNLTNTDEIEAGQQLKIPEVSPITQASPEVSPLITETSPISQTENVVISPVASPVPQASSVTITSPTYTIVRGDTLWSIAERAYGDPYRWNEIAKANKLENPDLIHAENVLTLPR